MWFSSPAIGSDGTVYVGSDDKKLYAINGKSGVKVWELVTGSFVGSSPAIGSDGTVYVGSKDKKLYAIKTDSKGPAKSPWPMRGQNAQHTGRAADSADPPVANPEPTDSNLGKIDSPEVLAKRTLDALSKNDFSALSKLGAESLPKEVLIETWVNLRYAATEENIKLTAQRRNITEEEAKEYLKEKIQKEKARMEEMYEKGIKEETADRRQSFDRVIAEGKKQANIDWGKVSFVRLEGKPFEKNGIKGGDFFIVLAYQGKNFKIKLDDCTHFPKHGWFLTHGPDWGDGTDDAGPPDETSEGESSHEEPAQPEPKAENPKADVALVIAAQRGDIEAVKNALTMGANVNARNEAGQNPLYFSVWNDHTEIVKILISNGAELNPKGLIKFTPLYSAAGGKAGKETIELLIAKGADLNFIRDRGEALGNETSLDRAIRKGRIQIADLLRKNGAKTAEELKKEDSPPQNEQSGALADFLVGKRIVFRTRKNEKGFYQFEKENYLTVGLIRNGELFKAPIPYYFNPAYKVYGLEVEVWDIPDMGSANETRLVFATAKPEVGGKIFLKQEVALEPEEPEEAENEAVEVEGKKVWQVLKTYTITGIEPISGQLKQTPEFQSYIKRFPIKVRAKNNIIKSGNVARTISGMLEDENTNLNIPANGKWGDLIVKNFNNPTGGRWIFLSPQLPQSSEIKHELRVSDPPDELPRVSHYAMNKSLVGQPIKKIYSASDTVVIFESELGWNGVGGLQDALKYMDKYKLDKIGVAFIDGSRKTPDREELKKLKWILEE